MAQDTSILKKRLKKVRTELAADKADALLVTGKADVAYLSGFTGDDSWLVVGGKNAYLVTDSRYVLQAQRDCAGCKIYERKGRMADAIEDILKKNPAVRTVAVEDKIRILFQYILNRNSPDSRIL